jgi:hypothetical protein
LALDAVAGYEDVRFGGAAVGELEGDARAVGDVGDAAVVEVSEGGRNAVDELVQEVGAVGVKGGSVSERAASRTNRASYRCTDPLAAFVPRTCRCTRM